MYPGGSFNKLAAGIVISLFFSFIAPARPLTVAASALVQSMDAYDVKNNGMYVSYEPSAGGTGTDTLLIPTSPEKISLKKYLSAWEDINQASTSMQADLHPAAFVPLDSLHQQNATSVYWLQMYVKNGKASAAELALSFSSLTFMDLYVYRDSICVLHKQAGAFRPEQDIARGDGRFHASFSVPPGETSRLLLKVHHTKHFRPVFDFALQQKDPFLQSLNQKKLVDALTQGALGLFFLYILLSWAVSRFRPYLWLLLYMGGIGLYSISTGGYLIEWFFPANPATGWIFNLNFLHLGCFGIYMLIIDFWQLKQKSNWLYRLGGFLKGLLIVLTLLTFCIDYFTGNFELANNLNLWASVFPLGFVICSLWVCWRRLTSPQRYLAYGLGIFLVSALFIVVGSIIWKEKSLHYIPFVTNFAILGVSVVFATGLKEELRQHEIDKLAALEKLNLLQQHQNILLEQKVEDRTEALRDYNQQLLEQKNLLADRNAKIETLINELNHRVKNNLQLLYSFISLQEPAMSDEASREILKENMGRIKAMMLVNQQLYRFEEQQAISLNEFVADLTAHLQMMYSDRQEIKLKRHIAAGIHLDSRHTLSFGLILLELLTNSFKYAFPHQADPVISIEVLSADEHTIRFTYSDNGKGMNRPAEGNASSMGLSLIRDLTRQMNGSMKMKAGAGLTYQFIIPI